MWYNVDSRAGTGAGAGGHCSPCKRSDTANCRLRRRADNRHSQTNVLSFQLITRISDQFKQRHTRTHGPNDANDQKTMPRNDQLSTADNAEQGWTRTTIEHPKNKLTFPTRPSRSNTFHNTRVVKFFVSASLQKIRVKIS